ncbi:MAG TPA: NAD(P)/FAD-dependent oxidoreductase [Nitrososphaeraceae archaeon]|nr:NAD(P)/FAD-dependent oxidoreductase [Nitrososphaeraceae archaeon]
MSEKYSKRILIAGGGYAGIQAALMLERLLNRTASRILLIDKNKYHTLLPSLPEIISKRGFSIINYTDIIKTKKIDFIQTTVTDIDLEKKEVFTSRNSYPLGYDFLIISLGSTPFLPNIPGLREYAIRFNTIQDAEKLANKLLDTDLRGNIVIGGAGATGVELAGEIASVLKHRYHPGSNHHHTTVILVSPDLLPGFPDSAVKWTRAYLQSLQVKLILGRECYITEVKPDSICLKNGSEIKTTMFIWTGGVTTIPLLQNIGLKTGSKGRVVVNKFLQAFGRDDVFVIGDAADIVDNQGHSLPTTAYFAEQHGKVAAQNIYALIKGKKLQEYRPGQPGSNFAISIGSNFAVSRVGGVELFGYSASKLKKLIKMKYLRDIGGSALAGKEYSKF